VTEPVPYPSERTAREVATVAAEAAIGSVPLVGGALAAILPYVLGRSYERRQEDWFNQLAADVQDLKEAGDRTWSELGEDDEFVDAVVQATRVAETTSQEEKLAALRNAVLHTLSGDAPSRDERSRFIRLIDEFTPAHLRMLSFLDDPARAFEHNGVQRPTGMSGPRKALLVMCLPEFSDDAWTQLLAADLGSAGLMAGQLGGVMTESGLWTSATTPLGKRFLQFIARPS
jgi:hypothetical protein